MLGSPAVAALQRIADRANDVLAAYTPGAFPLRHDVDAGSSTVPAADPLSAAAPNGAWFVTIDDRGARTYTRAGTFHVAADGTLRTADDARVLGFANGETAAGPLTLGEIDHALGRGRDARIEADGSLAYTRSSIDPRTRERSLERTVVGRLALARFPAGGNPHRIDATHFTAAAGVVPHIGVPADGTFGALVPNARDIGSVDLYAGLQRLSDAYVAFSALAAANRAQYDGDKVAMDLLK